MSLPELTSVQLIKAINKGYTIEVDEQGNRVWYLNGKIHRDGGPAYESADGERSYFQNGKLHREDGPAIEWADGTRFWYLNDNNYSEENWLRKLGREP